MGKTYCGALEVAMHLTGQYPDWWEGTRFNEPVDAWAASDTGETTRDILQREYLGDDTKGVEGVIPANLIVDSSNRSGISDAVDTVWVRHKSGGVSTLGFKSFDQGRKKFQGKHKHVIHLDEEPPEDVYTECLLRTTAVGDKPPGHVLLTMTPLSGMTQVVQLYLKDNAKPALVQPTGRVFIQAGWEDNPHLADSEREALILKTPAHELEARRKGIPSLGSGMVYPVAESRFVIEPRQIPDHWRRVYGLDFGWTNPTAGVFLAHDTDSDVVYVVGEYYVREVTPQGHAVSLGALGASWMPGVCDPAGQAANPKDGESLMEVYEKLGLKLTKANNSREAGIQIVLQRLQNGTVKVFSTCTNLLHELRMYARDEKGVPKKENDHLLDAWRYAVVSGLGIASSRQETLQTGYGSARAPLPF